MKVLRPLPRDRTQEQVWNHYQVEKAIAERLKSVSRDERARIYATMYDELFRQVPDHSRLTRRSDERRTRMANRSKMALVGGFLDHAVTFVEFAPGDCRFSLETAGRVKKVYAVDISDQRAPSTASPDNFNLIVYDGYRLDGVPQNSIDVVFSDQFIEHLHPEDVRLHFELAHSILKSGGKYVFRTPHAFTGPHDVSRYFSDEAEGFHLKEWTYIELRQLLRELRFSEVAALRQVKGTQLRVPYLCVQACEQVLAWLPRARRRLLARYLISSVCMVATK